MRHIVSVTRAPGTALQLLTQLEATFARMVVVAIGADTSVLPDVLDNATASPVLFVDAAYPRADEIALRCAKAFALEDTVLFGRILLLQAHARSRVLAADAELNAPPPPLPPGVARA